jgi:TetR/AcrR family transcriptional repressor of mexJK operon
MELGGRELRDVLFNFAERHLALVTSQRSLALLRLVIAEAPFAPDVCRSFMQSGPETTVLLLTGFLSQPEVSRQLRSDVSPEHLARHFINCLMGNHLSRLLLYPACDEGAALPSDIDAVLTLFLDGSRRRLP